MTWATARLGDVCEMQSGGTPRRGVGEYYGGSIPWAKISDLDTPDGVVSETEETITDAGLAAIGGRLFPKGTVLLAMYGSVGKLGVTGRSLATNQAILGIVPRDANRIDSRFLRRWLASKQPAFVAAARGVAQANISKTIVENATIFLPPLTEQRRIADVLDKADAIRRKRQHAVGLTDNLLRAAFLDIFGDPVTNVKGWRVCPLGEVAELFGGNSLPQGEPFTGQGGGYLLLKVGDMNLVGNEVDIVTAREWSDDVPPAATLAPAGAVVIPKRGGAIATNKKRVLRRAAALDPNLMAIAPSTALRLEYLRQWFEGIDLSSLSNGSTVPQLNKKDLAPLALPVPPLHVQSAFVRICERVSSLRIDNESAAMHATVMFDGLVARAFATHLVGAQC